jgi:cell division protein FtsQ
MAAARVLAVPKSAPLVSRQKRLPVLVAAERAWVLHKKLVLKLALYGLAAILVAGAVEMRGPLYSAGVVVVEAASTGLASAGFGIAAIDISGQVLTSEADIVGALAIGPRTSILAFDAKAARQRLRTLPAVADASIRKVYPDRLMVSVKEKTPIARWTLDGRTYLVDAAGTHLIDAPSTANADLPLVIGQGAGDDAAAIIRALGLYPSLEKDIVALSRIGDRRWDMLYDTGLRVQLPETGVNQALQRLDDLERGHAILERDLALIDLRVPGSTIVRLNERKQEN